MRTTFLTATIALCALAACSQTSKQSAGTSADAGACACQVTPIENFPTLVVPWDCYCAQQPGGCQSFWTPSHCDGGPRVDYPECGLTVLRTITIGGPIILVFDPDENLVGAQYGSDLSDYVCPTDPAKKSTRVRTGRFPDASCRAVACDRCDDSSFPCAPAAADGGAD